MNLRGTWERIGIRPWTFILLLLGVAIVLVGISLVARDFLPSCGSQEKAAITQFTHYGGMEAGKDLDIYGDELNWPPLQEPPPGCTLEEFAVSQASPKQVVEYYEKKQTEHGWEATVERYPADGEGPANYSVVGNRDGLRYDVYSFALEPDYEPADIRVNVYKP
jgi:hypothetical protein